MTYTHAAERPLGADLQLARLGVALMADTLRSAGGRRVPRRRRHHRARTRRSRPSSAIAGPLRLPAATPAPASPRRSTTPFAWGAAGARDGRDEGAGRRRPRRRCDAEMTVHVYGPADVTEIDPRQVIRAFPKADAPTPRSTTSSTSSSTGPTCRGCSRPAGPDATGRLVPWITLVVAERGTVEWGERRGAVRRATHPPRPAAAAGRRLGVGARAGDGHEGRDAEAAPTLEQRLEREQRRAQPVAGSSARAASTTTPPTSPASCRRSCAGAQAGLGPDAGDHADAGVGHGATSRRRSDDMVDLPVYYSWAFATGEDGNFESLARKLKPRVAPPGVGRRRVDATQPWLGDRHPARPRTTRAPRWSSRARWSRRRSPRTPRPRQWPTEAEQHWDAGRHRRRWSRKLQRRRRHQAHEPDPAPPLVGPPLYGGNHARQPRIETEAPAARAAAVVPRAQHRPAQPDRRRPRHARRAGRAGGPDGRGVEPGDRRRGGQPRAAPGAAGQARLAPRCTGATSARFDDAALLAVTERVHAKVLDAPRRSVWAAVEASSLPLSVTTGAFRRLTAAARAGRAGRRCASRARCAVDALTVRDDRLTTDWVLRLRATRTAIDGSVQPRGARITDARSPHGSRPGVDRDTLLREWADELAKPGAGRAARPASARAGAAADALDVGEPLVDAAAAGPAARRDADPATRCATTTSGRHRRAPHAMLLRVARPRRRSGRRRRARGAARTTRKRLELAGRRPRTTAPVPSSQIDRCATGPTRTLELIRQRTTGCRSRSSSARPSGCGPS